MSCKPKTRSIDFAARMQLVLSPRLGRAEVRSNQARERILQAGFWLQPCPPPSADVRQLYPAVSSTAAPTSNP